MLTPPLKPSAYSGGKLLNFGGCQWLHEDVSCVVSSGAIYDGNVSMTDMVTNEVMLHIDMLGACVTLIILCDGYHRLVVTEQGGGAVEQSGNLSEEGV